MSGSGMVRRSLGRRLKAMRIEAGKTFADVAASGVAKRAKLSRIEAGQVPVKLADVRTLCWLYKADEATTDALGEMALSTAGDGWWEDYVDVVPRWFSLYVELESHADAIWTWDGELIHGLLQTPAYHRAVLEADPVVRSMDSPDRQLALRAERQRTVFERTTPLHVTAILGAGSLDRMVGGPAVMADQRSRLFELSAQDNVDVRVLPWDAGAHVAMKGAFTILDFNIDEDPDVAYFETLSGGRYIEHPDVVQRYRDAFDLVSELSVTIKEYQR